MHVEHHSEELVGQNVNGLRITIRSCALVVVGSAKYPAISKASATNTDQ